MCFAPQRRALFRHFFDISTSKSGPRMVCFVHFHFEMCFAPQRRALFRHLNFQTWSGPGVLCAFWLRNVLRATTACTFSSLIWPDGSAPAALASLLFDPPEPQIIGKTQCFAAFLPFRASASSFFWLFLFYHLLSSALLFSLPLPSSAFHLSILSEVWLLNFHRPILRGYTEPHFQTHPNVCTYLPLSAVSRRLWGKEQSRPLPWSFLPDHLRIDGHGSPDRGVGPVMHGMEWFGRHIRHPWWTSLHSPHYRRGNSNLESTFKNLDVSTSRSSKVQ